MRSWFNRQMNFLRNSWSGGSAGFVNDANGNPIGAIGGANRPGMRQIRFETLNDEIYEEGLSKLKPLYAGALKFAPVAAIGAMTMAGNLDPNLGGPIFGAVGGATLGAAIAGKIAARSIKTAGFQATALKAGASVGGGLLGATIGGAVGLGVTGHPYAGLGVLGAGVGLHFLRGGVMRALGRQGITGAAGAAAVGVKSILGAATTAVRGAEFTARAILTGGIGGVQGPLDAWFPFFRNTPMIESQQATNLAKFRAGRAAGLGAKEAAAAAYESKMVLDPRKFAPNPRIVRRMVGIAAAGAVLSGLKEAMDPMVAPPTAYFDGRYMRHVNDMGANAHFARGILGPNSSLGLDYKDMTRMAAHVF